MWSAILGSGFKVQRFWEKNNFRFWILDFGFWILDLRSVSDGSIKM
ncbi:hypothetical protein D1AOALGA4SA_9242 [Olavius algarvensis Delta 1 endosymbiont]|nr:hypothetical protein D1AOALGA4SA_9242 [Olavius algarvensis Delta 1 endosymbiont]